MNTPIFSVRDLTLFTKQKKCLVDHVSIDLPAASFSVILGANGAGKSTFLRLLFGHLTPSSGEVYFLNQAISSFSPVERAKQIAWLGQDAAQDCTLNVEDFVMLGRRATLGALASPSVQDRALVTTAMVAQDIEHLKHRRYTYLSGGERQRAGIAQVFAQNTPVILMDEPSNHLDLRHRHGLMQRLKTAVAEGKTVIAVLHDLDLVARYADFVVLLDGGRLLASGATHEVLTDDNLSHAYQWPMKVVAEGQKILRIEAA